MGSVYHAQAGLAHGRQLPIKRGVKQANVLNPLFVNAGFEYAMKKWKFRVQHCGLHCGDDELLTNVRYADDWMLYERGDIDLASMVESLVEELAVVRLRPPPARCVPRPLLHDWKLAIHFASVLINAFATIKMCPIKRSMIMINVDAVVRRFLGAGRGTKKTTFTNVGSQIASG